MHPAGHALLGAITFSLVRRRGPVRALTIAAASVLADADHLAWHAARTGGISVSSAWRHFTMNNANSDDEPVLLLHRWRVIVALALAGVALPPVRWLAGGLALHALTDFVDGYTGPWWRGRAVRRRTALHRQVFERAGRRCEACGATHVRLHAHHRVQRADGGADTLANLVALCGPCHDATHGR